MALPREAHPARSGRERPGRRGVILAHPAADVSVTRPAEERGESVDAIDVPPGIGVVESRVLDAARLEGVRLAAREMAHLLNNDLAVAVGLVELLRDRTDLPPHLRDLLESAVVSLDSAASHIKAFQTVARVAVKDTPAGISLDLERSQLG